MGMGGKGEDGRGGEGNRGDPICIFKFSSEQSIRLSNSHNISKRVKMTVRHSIVVYMQLKTFLLNNE